MKSFATIPRVLRRKVILTIAVGTGCFFVGGAWYLCTWDKILLVISTLIFLFSAIRTFALYHTVTNNCFKVVEGVCMKITSRPFSRQYSIRVLDSAGAENALRLDNQTRVKIGSRYRFYFSDNIHVSLGSNDLDAALSFGQFLGCEELEDGVADDVDHLKEA